MDKEYKDFLSNKIKIAEKTGFEIKISDVHSFLKPHQKEVVVWNVAGGCRADFLSFGLGKTVINLETAKQVLKKYPSKKALIVCPLGVKPEFHRDGKKIGIDHIEYLTNSSYVTDDQDYYITNYERIRKGDIDPDKFVYIGMDEASILRGLDTQTTDMIMSEFKSIPHRFVYTATPSPNRYLELTHYADYLGIMDRGQILTRFFQRDSTTAGNLTLFERREKEFWMWMSSWACFITKPSDLGYSDEGYNLPALKINRHMVSFDRGVIKDRRDNQIKMYADSSKSLEAAAKEKRESLEVRIKKMQSIVNKSKDDHFIIWHDLESERQAIQKSIGEKCKSVYGKQDYDQREKIIIDFSDGKIPYLSTKPSIAGSGCNFQYHCHRAVFVGINYKFNDFIQAIHRIYRFLQDQKCIIDIIFTDAEEAIMKALEKKWHNHLTLQSEMTAIIRKFGLNSELYRSDLSRQFFTKSKKYEGKKFVAINDDNVKAIKPFEDNSLGLICTSIPFGNHYEYSENYECFGHNATNEDFFKQMDFLTPHLLRTLQPGRICAVHVKDRIRYSYMNGTGFTSIEPFSDHTNMHFLKHGFHSIGRITITTDVVSENNQTYRLGWSEKCKDGSKMGVGLPEYVLLFRKAPTDSSNAYADLPVVHSKEDYTRARWQLDAHSYWKSNGERLADTEQLKRMDASNILKLWKELEFNQDYDFDLHEKICFELDKLGKLPTKYMAMPPISKNPDVWTDIVRMNTLNTEQSRRNQTKHICLATGTLVLTKRGYIPIEETEIGDMTFTHKGRWRKILAKRKTGENKDVVQTKAQGVPLLITTPDHKLWAKKHKGYRPSETFIENGPDWAEAQNLKSHYVNQKLPNEIKINLNELDCWIIGRWLADGHLDYREHQFIISVGNKKIPEFEEKCKDYIGAKNNNGSCTQYGMKKLPETVRSILFKCGKGAENKTLPIELICLNKELSDSLLNGYLSGDGHLDKKGVYHASSASRKLLLGLSIVAQRAWKIIPSVYASKKPHIHTIEGRKVNAKQLWVMTLRRNGHHSFGKILEDGAWKKVNKIESKGKSDVWNIHVEEDNSFTAEGCIVKNCPLQLDLIERIIERYSNPGEVVCDPFAGVFSVIYKAIKMGRRGLGMELNAEYYNDGVKHIRNAEINENALTLFG